jgi:hypothetical protein
VVVTMLSDADATIGLEGSERCAALARDRGLI